MPQTLLGIMQDVQEQCNESISAESTKTVRVCLIKLHKSFATFTPPLFSSEPSEDVYENIKFVA